MTDDIRKLLGGYATGTLTDDERKALYEAALEDQALFEALADEQALKDLLEDSTARAALLETASETPRFSPAAILREWFERPRSKALVAVGAVLFLSIGIREVMQRTSVEHKTETVAVLRSAPEPPRAALPAERDSAPPAKSKTVAPRRIATAEAPKLEKKDSADLADNAMSKPQVVAPVEEVRVAAAPMMAAAPPPPAARVAEGGGASAQKTVASGEVHLTYTLLLRNPSGEYLPVPQDYAFSPGDRARVRVSTNRRGVLAATGPDGKAMFGGAMNPGVPVTLPGDLTFEQPDAPQVDLQFSPLPESGAVLGFAAEQAAQSVRPESTLRAKQETAAPRAPAGAPSISVRVTLKKK